MESKQPGPARGFRQELRIMLRRGRQVWKLVPRRHKLSLGAAAFVMALTSAASTALPLLLGKLVDEVNRGSDQGQPAAQLYQIALFFLSLIAAAYVLRESLNVLRRHLVENACTRLEKAMTVRLVGHLMRVDLAALTHEKIGALHGRISRSVVGFVRFLRMGFLDFFPPLITGSFAMAAAFSKHPSLGIAMLGVIPLSLYLTVRQLASQKGVRLALIRSRELMDGTVVELLSGIDYVRAANTQDLETTRVARAAERRRGRELYHHIQMSLYGCAKAINEGFFHILVISLAIYYAIHQQISFGDVLTFSMLFLNVMGPLAEVHRVLDEGHELSLMVGDLLDLLAEPVDPSFAPPATREPVLEYGAPLLVMDNLRVEYRTANGRRRCALENVSLTIRHGETIGVAGRSGSGKSTWLRVLMRLTHPSGGKVFIGGVPLDMVSRESIGRLLGYVGQSPFVFAGTIAENIAYGNHDATEEDIRRAAERACIHDEIMALHDGYETQVSEMGRNLSGGQRQRLALARVFLKNPPVLILDEGTSALDTISERCVQRAIEDARADRTVILVAHRLSTLLSADRILVFDGGRIVETGTYDELLRRGGVFAELSHCAQTSPTAETSPGGEGVPEECAASEVA